MKKLSDKQKNDLWTIMMVLSCLMLFTYPIMFVLVYFEMKDYRSESRRLLYSGLGAITLALFMMLAGLFGALLGGMTDVMKIFAVYYGIDLVIGAFMIGLYLIRTNRRRRITKCIRLVEREHFTEIPQISEILGIPEEKTRKALQQGIRQGLLEGADVPENGKEIVFQKSVWAKQHVVCENCGAEDVVNLGQTLTCSFCGGALKARRIRHIQD